MSFPESAPDFDLATPETGLVGRGWRSILMYASFWFAFGVFGSIGKYLAFQGQDLGVSWGQTLQMFLGYAALWAIISPLIYRAIQAKQSRAGFLILVRLIGLGVLVLAIMLFYIGFASRLILNSARPDLSSWVDWAVSPNILGFARLTLLIYLLITLVTVLIRQQRERTARHRIAQQAALHTSELERQLAQSRLTNLHSQLQPHFLFNTLNSIASLVDSGDTSDAYDAIEKLGRLLRRNLDMRDNQMVALHEELGYIQGYIDLERGRFGDRLHVEWAIEPDAEQIRIPAMILQPLVENAIKHGVAKTSKPVTLKIVAACRGGHLEIVVNDNGPGLAAGPTGLSVGLTNIRERLSLLYGNNADLELTKIESGGACAKLRVPLNPTFNHETFERD